MKIEKNHPIPACRQAGPAPACHPILKKNDGGQAFPPSRLWGSHFFYYQRSSKFEP